MTRTHAEALSAGSEPNLVSGPGRTLYRKLLDGHTVVELDAEHVLLYADLHVINEYTSPQAFAGLQARGIPVARPQQNIAVVDHVIPTHAAPMRTIQDPASALQATRLKQHCAQSGIPLFDTNDPLQGIEHVIAPELGMIRPGMVVLCGDSHTTPTVHSGHWASVSGHPKSSMCWQPKRWCIDARRT